MSRKRRRLLAVGVLVVGWLVSSIVVYAIAIAAGQWWWGLFNALPCAVVGAVAVVIWDPFG